MFLLTIFLVGFAPFCMGVQAHAQDTQTSQNSDDSHIVVSVAPNGPSAVFDTSMGPISCKFFEKQAPKTVAIFIGLAEGTKSWIDPYTQTKVLHKHYYDGTKFTRVVPEFIIQGGDNIGNGRGTAGFTFPDEIDPYLSFDTPGKLAMANSGKNTNGGQFFITEQADTSLDQRYTIFGQCDLSSVEVIKAIARVKRDRNDKPIQSVVLKTVTIVRQGEPPPQSAATASESTPASPARSEKQASKVQK